MEWPLASFFSLARNTGKIPKKRIKECAISLTKSPILQLSMLQQKNLRFSCKSLTHTSLRECLNSRIRETAENTCSSGFELLPLVVRVTQERYHRWYPSQALPVVSHSWCEAKPLNVNLDDVTSKIINQREFYNSYMVARHHQSKKFITTA